MSWFKRIFGSDKPAHTQVAAAASAEAPSESDIDSMSGDADADPVTPYRLLTPESSQRLGPWASAFPAYEEIVGYSLLGHFFMRNPNTSDYMVLHPFKGAAKSYGPHDSVEDFEREVLNEPGFSSYVLRDEHVAAIHQRLGAPGEDQIYIPEPYPFLGGTEEPETYALGDVWVFMDIVAQMRGLEA